MTEERYRNAYTFAEFAESAEKNEELRQALYERARVPDEIVERVRALPGRWHLLALTEDWCGDAVNTLPLLARLTEAVPNLELRLLERDENPDLMDAHLTDGSRSIPVVMALDEEFREHGWWGPRPEELQAWVVDEGLELPSKERYRRIRRWHARDRGETTLDEIASLLEAAAASHAGA